MASTLTRRLAPGHYVRIDSGISLKRDVDGVPGWTAYDHAGTRMSAPNGEGHWARKSDAECAFGITDRKRPTPSAPKAPKAGAAQTRPTPDTAIDLTEQAGPADDVPPLKSAIASLLALPLSEETMRAALSDLTRSGD